MSYENGCSNGNRITGSNRVNPSGCCILARYCCLGGKPSLAGIHAEAHVLKSQAIEEH